MIESAVLWLLNILAIPTVGLTSVFLISFISATLLPLGSEPVLMAYLQLQPGNVWPALALATANFVTKQQKCVE